MTYVDSRSFTSDREKWEKSKESEQSIRSAAGSREASWVNILRNIYSSFSIRRAQLNTYSERLHSFSVGYQIFKFSDKNQRNETWLLSSPCGSSSVKNIERHALLISSDHSFNRPSNRLAAPLPSPTASERDPMYMAVWQEASPVYYILKWLSGNVFEGSTYGNFRPRDFNVIGRRIRWTLV